MTDIQDALQGEILAPDEWTPEQAAGYVAEAWQKAVGSIVETGQRLIEVKDRARHGNWLRTVEMLPFSERTARALMQIAKHPDLSNRQHVADLPAAWGTLAVLAQLPPGEIPRRIEAHEITADLDRATAQQWVSTYAVARQEALNEWGSFTDAITAALSYAKTWTPPADTDTYASLDEVAGRLEELAMIVRGWEKS